MALITCPDCGAEVSDTASACPKCGCVTGFASERKKEALLDKKAYEKQIFKKQHIGLYAVTIILEIIGLFSLIAIIFGTVFIFSAAFFVLLWLALEALYYSNLNSSYQEYIQMNK